MEGRTKKVNLGFTPAEGRDTSFQAQSRLHSIRETTKKPQLNAVMEGRRRSPKL